MEVGPNCEQANPDSDPDSGTSQDSDSHAGSSDHDSLSHALDVHPPGTQETRRSITDTPCYRALVTGSGVSSCFGSATSPPNKTLKRNIHRLEVKFASLVKSITEKLQSQGVDAGPMNTFLTLLHTARKENQPELAQPPPHGLTKVCDVINHFSIVGAWDFLNFLLLVDLIEKYECGIEGDMAKYREEIEEFKKVTKLRDFLKAWSGRSTITQEENNVQGVVDLTVKVDGTWPDFTLADLSDKEGFMEEEFQARQFVFQLRNGRGGCVRLIWVVPLSVAESMKKTLLDRKPNLIEGGILQLAIKGDVYYEAPTCPWRGETYASLYQKSLEDPDQFWGGMAARYLQWEGIFDTVSDMEKGVIKWFTGGKLNVSVNCLDRHVDEDPNRIALIWEKNEPGQEERYTYQKLLEITCRVAGVLKSHGVEKNDEVIIYLPPCPLAVASMLACARIGAVHIVISAQIDTDGLQKRIKCANARAVITAVSYKLGLEELHLKDKIDTAVTDDTVAVLVSVENESKIPLRKQDVNLEEAMKKERDWCPAELMDSEDRLFIMYTSGTSDPSPTGIVHSQAGYLLYVAMTHQFVFDYRPGEVFACDADLGWITGHSYVVYGPLCNGGTTVLFGSKATYPNPDRYWKMVERLKVNHLYSTPSTLGKLMMARDSHIEQCNLSSLKNLGTVGQPIKPKLWNWYHSVVGRGKCPILDTWWQTETGGIAIVLDPPENANPVPSKFPPGPFFGVDPAVMAKHEESNIEGILYLSKPLPAMCRKVLSEVGSVKDLCSWASGYCTSDVVQKGSRGGLCVIARVNDVIRVKDQQLDIPKIEDQMEMSDSKIAEAILIASTHSEGPGTVVYVEVEGCGTLGLSKRRELVNKARKAVAEKSVLLDVVVFVDSHPRTFNGKVHRYALREADIKWQQVGGTNTEDGKTDKDGTYFEVSQTQDKLRRVLLSIPQEYNP